MSYKETEGIILRRRNLFEQDQEIALLTPSFGAIDVRVPHARKSQKTYCGRLEPPNLVSARLYRSKQQSARVLSEVEIRTNFSDLMRTHDLRHEIWPVLSLFRDLYPDGEVAGNSYYRLRRALEFLKNGFRPASLVTARLLAQTARSAGIQFDLSRCLECGTRDSDYWYLILDRGLFCESCAALHNGSHQINEEVRKFYYGLVELPWQELCSSSYDFELTDQIESLLYRLFHFHFEISLDALKVRQSL